MLTSDDRFQMEAREVGAGVQELTERLVRETLTMAIAQDMHTLRSTPQGFAEILASYREERESWRRDDRLKPEVIDTEIKALKLRTVERLDLIDRAAKSAHERVMPKLAMHERGSEESPTESLARETAAARAWARWRPLLESGRLAPEALIERERERGVPPSQVLLAGFSQGGAMALAVAGLARHRGVQIAGCAADVPFLCHFSRAIGLTAAYPYQEVVDYLATYPMRVRQVMTTLSYFDGMSMAARATAAGLFSVGLMDEIAPPSTVYAAYHHYAGEKRIEVYPYNGHEGGGSYQLERIHHWLAELTA